MAYTPLQIIGWAAVCQPLARIGESKKRANTGGNIDTDLDMKLLMTRLDCEYEYAQDPASDNLFSMCNYLLSLCGVYLFEAITATGGGTVTPINPITPVVAVPDPYFFAVDSSTSFIITGETSKTITDFIGYNLVFVRNGITQTTVTSEPSYYSWDRSSGLFTFSPASAETELFGLIPV